MTPGALADALDRRLTPFVEQLMSLTRIPGMAVGVVADGSTVYARGFGVASLDHHRQVTVETLFHMASVTKPFVATAIMQLVEEGIVALDDPVVRHLPYLRMADESIWRHHGPPDALTHKRDARRRGLRLESAGVRRWRTGTLHPLVGRSGAD
jgi:CubicO group peptidase (beta-lactamase class C family)